MLSWLDVGSKWLLMVFATQWNVVSCFGYGRRVGHAKQGIQFLSNIRRVG